MTRMLWTIPLALWLLAGPTWAVGAQEMQRTLTLTGEAEASSPPDMALVTLGATSEGASAAAAVQANAKAIREVIEALRGSGIEERDVQTSGLSVQPRYGRGPKSGEEKPTIVGYTASNQLRVRVRSLSSLGGLIDRVVAAGSNELRGVAFDITQRDRLMDEARRGAVRDAVRKAELYAAASGVKLGDVVAITEEPAPIHPVPMGGAALASAARAVPIEPGEIVLRAQVRMVWRIAP